MEFAEQQQQGTYVLNEIIRFLCAATSYTATECAQLWLTHIRTYTIDDDVTLLQLLIFTIDNTLNTELLERTATLLLNITYFDEKACTILVEQHDAILAYVRALREALQQDNEHVMDCILRMMEILSSRYEGDEISTLFIPTTNGETSDQFTLLDVLCEILENASEVPENAMVCKLLILTCRIRQ
jgi:hypothetical protein